MLLFIFIIIVFCLPIASLLTLVAASFKEERDYNLAMERMEDSKTTNEIWAEGYKIGFNRQGRMTFFSGMIKDMPDIRTYEDYLKWIKSKE